jgi:hypothetical protein
MTKSPRIVELQTLAQELNIPPDWLLGEVQSGRIPGVPTGQSFLVDRPTVERHFLRQLRRTVESRTEEAR